MYGYQLSGFVHVEIYIFAAPHYKTWYHFNIPVLRNVAGWSTTLQSQLTSQQQCNLDYCKSYN